MANNMEIKILAKNLHFSPASSSKINPNLENLRKQRFIGPTMCHLFHHQEETMEHLLNNYPFSEEI